MKKQLRTINNSKRAGLYAFLCIQDFYYTFLKPYGGFRFSEYLYSTNDEIMRAICSF